MSTGNKLKLRKAIVDEYGLEENTADDNVEIGCSKIMQAVIVMKMVQNDGEPCVLAGYEYLAIGSIGCAYNITKLKAYGITHILCLAAICKIKFIDDFSYKRVSLKDNHQEDLLGSFNECFEFINNARASSGKVLVHCFKGVSRSAAVCCAYLMRYESLTVDDGIRSLRACRPIISPNLHFMRMLHQYFESIHQT